MKTIKLLLVLFSLAIVASCENYPDREVEYSPIFPLSGEWRVRVTDMNTNALVTSAMYTFGTYNTSDNATNQMWIRTTSNMAGGLGAMRGKISCDVADLSFSGENISDASAASATFSITEGKVTLEAISMPSGVKADKISFKYTTSKVPGTTFLFEGYRRTLWPADESFVTFE
jgi:hypothetical protein